MNSFATGVHVPRARRRKLVLLGLTALTLVSGVAPAQAVDRPPRGVTLPPAAQAALEDSRKRSAQAPPLAVQQSAPPAAVPDPNSPASRARAAGAAYDRADADPANGGVRAQLRGSRSAFDQAMAEWRSGDTRVPEVIAHLAAAAGQLRTPTGAPIAPAVGASLSGIARQIAGDIVEAYGRAGADRELNAQFARILATADAQISAGNHDAGIEQLKQVFDFGPQMVFDMALFEQNLQATFDTRTVGYSYAIARDGKLQIPTYANGDARLNAPLVDQSATKEMNIASVSKTLTAVAVLRLLEARGLSIDSQINPWLPASWTKGPGIAEVGGLTFKELLTHKSGLNNNDGTRLYDYASLRSAIAAGTNAPQNPRYQNANFALFRVLIPRLFRAENQSDLDSLEQLFVTNEGQTFADLQMANLYAFSYVAHMRTHLFAPMGIDGLCQPDDGNKMTLLYNPGLASGGINAGDWTSICGSGGWYLSATEVVAFLAHMRYNNSILSPAMRTVMNQNFTGWMDPFSYSWGDGLWGTYHNHGGDLWWDTDLAAGARRGMDSCVMSFPNGVQIAMLINSQGPAYPGHALSNYQCAAIEAAFDNALVLTP